MDKTNQCHSINANDRDYDKIKLVIEIPALILLTITVDYGVYYNIPIYCLLLLLLNLSMNVEYHVLFLSPILRPIYNVTICVFLMRVFNVSLPFLMYSFSF